MMVRVVAGDTRVSRVRDEATTGNAWEDWDTTIVSLVMGMVMVSRGLVGATIVIRLDERYVGGTYIQAVAPWVAVRATTILATAD
jgi:hypothetical protein